MERTYGRIKNKLDVELVFRYRRMLVMRRLHLLLLMSPWSLALSLVSCCHGEFTSETETHRDNTQKFNVRYSTVFEIRCNMEACPIKYITIIIIMTKYSSTLLILLIYAFVFVNRKEARVLNI